MNNYTNKHYQTFFRLLNFILYFTNWTLFIILIGSPIYKYINVLYLSLFVLVSSTGMLILDTNPFKDIYTCEMLTYHTFESITILHTFFHILPFIYVLLSYYRLGIPFNSYSFTNSLLLIFAYALLNNTYVIYGTTITQFSIYITICLIIYYIILNRMLSL